MTDSPKKTDKDYEALNRKLIAALITMTGAFMLIVFCMYWFLGRN